MQIVVSSEGFLYCVGFAAWHVAVTGITNVEHPGGIIMLQLRGGVIMLRRNLPSRPQCLGGLMLGAGSKADKMRGLRPPKMCPMLEKGAVSMY